MRKKILWVSLCAPYDKVGHGGGKTHNFYLKKINESRMFDIELISFCGIEEYNDVITDLNSYSLKNNIIPWTHCINKENIYRKLYLWDMENNPFNRYAGATNKYYWQCIKKITKSITYSPDIVILQWTEIVLFSDKIKKIFPKAKIVAIEEDVKYLAYKRKIDLCTNEIGKRIATLKYQKLKKQEMLSLAKTDLIITYSEKDRLLLKDNKYKAIVLSPYFENMVAMKRNFCPNADIVFYGAMSRQDNYDSAIWFIENVFYKLPNRYNFRFIIVGNKPDKKLLKYASDNIIVTGYVEKIDPYFQNSLCFVAPLVSGAGIKIKILEALSSGIPVLTNDIGIEGINAEPGKTYLHCQEPKEYMDAILGIINGNINTNTISRRAKEMIKNNYNLDTDVNRFLDQLFKLCKGE